MRRAQYLTRGHFAPKLRLPLGESPAGVCPQCGEKIVKADVGRQIATIIADIEQMQPVRSINVPVLQFKLAA